MVHFAKNSANNFLGAKACPFFILGGRYIGSVVALHSKQHSVGVV